MGVVKEMVGLRGLMSGLGGVAALAPARAGSRPYEAMGTMGTFALPSPVIYHIQVLRTLCQARSVRARDGTAAPITIGRAVNQELGHPN